MSFRLVQGIDGSLTLKNLVTGVDVATISAADVLAFNATSITMTRAALLATGTNAATAAPIVTQIAAVTGVDNTTAVALPAAATTTGPILVINTVQDKTLPVFPVSGGNDNINALAEDAAYTMGPGQMAWFVPTSATQWYVTGHAAITATPSEINSADVSARTQELTATGAVTAGVQSVELNHASVVIAATIADAAAHQGIFHVKDTSATGTAAHTLTLTSGTFNGTNNVATFNALNEALVVYFDSAGNGTVLENVGSVALS